MDLDEKIKKLQLKNDLTQAAKLLFEKPESIFFHKEFKKIKEDVKNQLVIDIKNFLTDYIENLVQENGVGVKKNNNTQPIENTKQNTNLQNSEKKVFTPQREVYHNSEKEEKIPFRARLTDTSYFYDCYESINPSPVMDILVLEKVGSDMFKACPFEDKQKEFLVPEDSFER